MSPAAAPSHPSFVDPSRPVRDPLAAPTAPPAHAPVGRPVPPCRPPVPMRPITPFGPGWPMQRTPARRDADAAGRADAVVPSPRSGRRPCRPRPQRALPGRLRLPRRGPAMH